MTRLDDDPSPAEIEAEAREMLDTIHDRPGLILTVWLLRVVLAALAIWLADRFFGPVGWLWWVLPVYAALSLVLGFARARAQNRQLDRIARLYDRRGG